MPQIVSPRVRRSANGSTTPLLAFPEGCNTVGGCMVPFTQLSALHATAVVLPTVLAYDTANSFNLSWTPRYPLARTRPTSPRDTHFPAQPSATPAAAFRSPSISPALRSFAVSSRQNSALGQLRPLLQQLLSVSYLCRCATSS